MTVIHLHNISFMFSFSLPEFWGYILDTRTSV